MPDRQIRHSNSYSWKEKILCARCNNEFSGSLDGMVKPSLEPMVRGLYTMLDPSAQADLGRWCLKVALIVAHTQVTGTDALAVEKVAHDFWSTGEPPGNKVRVYTNGAAVRSVTGEQLGLEPAHKHAERWLVRESTHSSSFYRLQNGAVASAVVSFVVGKAAFRVVVDMFLLVADGRPNTVRPDLLRIYPVDRPLIWPTRMLAVDFSRPE